MTVMEAAKEKRDRLETGLTSCCKTNGCKGLHLTTPFASWKTKFGCPEAKQVAQEVCDQIAQDAPDQRRIFLDYFRNDRKATDVSPLSPRVKAGATGSMPITGGSADLNLKKVAIRTVPTLVAMALDDYLDAERPLEEAIKLIAKPIKATA
ncbi:hypothetical protein [Rhizobium sp.]|uniref:non-homologous end-joining DNA ligase LigD n=1 Tax=Rhizobium sp. TaxID=391 RepID=UPI0028AB2698